MDMFPPSTFDRFSERGWAEWDLAHIAAHGQIGLAALKAGKQIASFPIQTDRNSDEWKAAHQMVHSSLVSGLAINAGYSNFTDVNFDNEEEFSSWMYYHALAHKQFRFALGL